MTELERTVDDHRLRLSFVTGGAGFLGQHLIAALRERGVEVRALTRSDRAARVVSDAGAIPVRGDLDDVDGMRAGMEACDAVFHLAAHVSELGTYQEFYRTNVEGTKHVIAATRNAHVPRLVHVSTEAVLVGGRPIVNADETWPRPRHPLGFYAQTKGLAEELVIVANGAGLATVVVRPRFMWGPGDTTVLPQFAQAVRRGRFLWIQGGHYLTSTCYVDNACAALILAAERGRGGEIYFVTDGPPVEFRTFITDLLATQHLAPGKRTIPHWLARGIAGFGETIWPLLRLRGAPPLTRTAVHLIGEEVTVSDAKARRELGYREIVAREEGLARLAMAAASDGIVRV